MGLDMYLFAEPNQPSTATEFQPSVMGLSTDTFNGLPEILYWRKANAIHKWFVDNVQGGVDDQKIYPVSQQQLRRLLDDISTVLCNRSYAETLLPPQAGFFFGPTEIDEDYFVNLEFDHDALVRLFGCVDLDCYDFYYCAWW